MDALLELWPLRSAGINAELQLTQILTILYTSSAKSQRM